MTSELNYNAPKWILYLLEARLLITYVFIKRLGEILW